MLFLFNRSATSFYLSFVLVRCASLFRVLIPLSPPPPSVVVGVGTGFLRFRFTFRFGVLLLDACTHSAPWFLVLPAGSVVRGEKITFSFLREEKLLFQRRSWAPTTHLGLPPSKLSH